MVYKTVIIDVNALRYCNIIDKYYLRNKDTNSIQR